MKMLIIEYVISENIHFVNIAFVFKNKNINKLSMNSQTLSMR